MEFSIFWVSFHETYCLDNNYLQGNFKLFFRSTPGSIDMSGTKVEDSPPPLVPNLMKKEQEQEEFEENIAKEEQDIEDMVAEEDEEPSQKKVPTRIRGC